MVQLPHSYFSLYLLLSFKPTAPAKHSHLGFSKLSSHTCVLDSMLPSPLKRLLLFHSVSVNSLLPEPKEVILIPPSFCHSNIQSSNPIISILEILAQLLSPNHMWHTLLKAIIRSVSLSVFSKVRLVPDRTMNMNGIIIRCR